jgi:hypothetical protein
VTAFTALEKSYYWLNKWSGQFTFEYNYFGIYNNLAGLQLTPEFVDRIQSIINQRDPVVQKIVADNKLPITPVAKKSYDLLLKAGTLDYFKQLGETLVQEHTLLVNAAAHNDPHSPLLPFGVTGNLVGMAQALVAWSRFEHEKKPYFDKLEVQMAGADGKPVNKNLAEVATALPKPVQDSLHKLKEFEGKKVTPKNSGKLQKIVDEINAHFE